MKITIKKSALVSIAVSLALVGTSAFAKISSEQAARLSNDLTPMGAER
ncbi:MAG: hypothetical protein HRT52_22040, partial [Colwellia sp.]|nr:hypothetical protein [Colwellia sp.]